MSRCSHRPVSGGHAAAGTARRRAVLERGWASSGWRASDLDPTPAAACRAGLGTGPAAPADSTAPARPTAAGAAAAAVVGWATAAAGLTTAVRLAWATEAVAGRATRLGAGWARAVAVVAPAIAGDRRCTSIPRSSFAFAAALRYPTVAVARAEPEARRVWRRRPAVVGVGRSSPAWAQLVRRGRTERRILAAASIRTTSTATSPALPLLPAGSWARSQPRSAETCWRWAVALRWEGQLLMALRWEASTLRRGCRSGAARCAAYTNTNSC